MNVWPIGQLPSDGAGRSGTVLSRDSEATARSLKVTVRQQFSSKGLNKRRE